VINIIKEKKIKIYINDDNYHIKQSF